MNAKTELQKKLADWNRRIGELAYQKIQIESDIRSLETAVQAGQAVLADMTTEEAIIQAKKNEEAIQNV